MAETESREHDSALWSTTLLIIVLQLRGSECASTTNWTGSLVDNVLDQPAKSGRNLERTSFERHITCYGIESV